MGAPVNGIAAWPLFRLGFRPFYLCAATFACVAVPVWLGLFSGSLSCRLALAPLLWHAHELLFGFAAAVIVGFLLTAGKAWTGLATPRGMPLAAMVVLWISARLAAVVGPYPVYAALDIALLPWVAIVLLRVLLRAGSRRNLPLVAILLLLTLANLGFHLAASGVVAVNPLRPLYAGLALIVMIECVIAGRVIPAFSMGALPGLKLVARPGLDAATLGVTALALACWALLPPGFPTAAALALAALLHLARQYSWRPLLTRARPILWILHAGYAWIAPGFGLLALAQLDLVSVSAGVHALAVGATSGLIIGMITRTARGHTARPLQASKPEVLAYCLVMLAAVMRVLLPLIAPQFLMPVLLGAAVAWTTAFAIYLVVYTPWLMAARMDGKDG